LHADNSALWVRFSLLALLTILMVGGASAATTIIDDFEDGNINGWTGDTGSFTASNTNALSGSYSGRLTAAADSAKEVDSPDFGQTSYTTTFKVKVESFQNRQIQIVPYTDSGTRLGIFELSDSGNINWYNGNGFVDTNNDFSSGTEYTFELDYSFSSDEVELFKDGSSLGTYDLENSASSMQYIKLDNSNIGGSSSRSVWIDDLGYIVPNQPPQLNSSSISPDPPLISQSVSYGAEVSDPDGSVDYTNLTLEYGGSTFVSDEQRTGTTPSWDDIFTPQTGDKWLNATLEVVDDQGAVTTKEINRYLSDETPSVSLQDPGNQTYFKYDVPLQFSVSDSDSEPGEDWTCSVDKDGSLYKEYYLKEGTNSTVTDTINSDLGSHTVDVTCSDGSGNTDTSSETYTVDNFQISSSSASNSVYETTNQSFAASLTAGKMVNEVTTDLYWDNQKTDSETFTNSGINSFSQVLRHEIPLVNTNHTQKNWKLAFKVNYTGFNGNNQELNLNSTQKSQNIWWSYYLEKSFYTPDNKYIETEDLQHNARIHTETKKADLTGTTTYKRDSSTDNMQIVDSNNTQSTYRGVIDTGTADSFNQSNFQAESQITVQFKGNTRNIATGNDQLELYRIQLFDTANPGNLNTEKTLEFDIDYEEEGYDTPARLTMDLSVWKNQDEKIRRFQFQEPESTEHSYHIYPSWAEYTIQTKSYPEQTKFDLIQYFNPDDNKVRRSYFFPVPQTISNDTTTVPLKTINQSEATQIDFEVTQSGGQPAENVYCRVDRKFGGGDFETVFMIKTGGQGNSQSFAEVNEIYYSFTCYKNGEIIETFPAQIMQNPMVLNIGETQVETGLDYSNEFDANCSFNQTQISCNYMSQTEKLEKAVLQVDRIEPVTDIQVCNSSSPTATGTLTCNGINTSTDSYRYQINGEYSNNIEILGAAGVTGNQSNQYGAAGIILTLFIFLFVYAATSFNVPIGIGLGTLSILFSSLAGFLVLTPAMRATLIALAIVAGVVTRK